MTAARTERPIIEFASLSPASLSDLTECARVSAVLLSNDPQADRFFEEKSGNPQDFQSDGFDTAEERTDSMTLDISLRSKQTRESLVAMGSSAAVTATIFVFLVVLPTCSAFAERWTAEALPPRPTLPIVSVELGEPGKYVPIERGQGDTSEFRPFTRIVLTAVNGDYPFDGYIGYEIVVGEIETRDIPVLARAVLAPGERWSFSTYFHLISVPAAQMAKRELAISWTNRKTRQIAQVSVGIPPWSKRRVLLVSETAPADHAGTAFGLPAYVSTPAALSDVSQWYTGFSRLVVPTSLWLDLPVRVREAILGSGLHVTFVGTPRASQPLTAIDRALLPVEFEPVAGSYEIPWPYGNGRVSTAVNWKPKAGTFSSSGEGAPILVESRIARYAADASILNRPEAFVARSSMPQRKELRKGSSGVSRRIVADRKPFVAALIALAIGVAAWLFLLRRRIVIAVSATLLLAALLLAQRDSLFLRSGIHTAERLTALSAEIASERRVFVQFGESPLGEIAVTSKSVRTAVWDHGDVHQDAEIRTLRTPPGFGKVTLNRSAWDLTSRWMQTNRVAAVSGISVTRRSPEEIAFRVASSIPSQYVAAQWISDGRLFYGEARGERSTDGELVVRAGDSIPEFDDREYDEVPGFDAFSVRLWLFEESRLSSRAVHWALPAESRDLPHFRILGLLRETEDSGDSKVLFAIPPEAIQKKAFSVIVWKWKGVRKNRELTITGEKGSVRGLPIRESQEFHTTFDATEAVRSVVGNSGFFELSATKDGDESDFIYVVVKDEKA